jgi:hypothetical protein
MTRTRPHAARISVVDQLEYFLRSRASKVVVLALDASIKGEIGADKLIKRGYVVLAVSSVINFLSVLYFLALAWHTTAGHASAFPLDNLPEPWNWSYYAVHASGWW